jgi:hypothetical protein
MEDLRRCLQDLQAVHGEILQPRCTQLKVITNQPAPATRVSLPSATQLSQQPPKVFAVALASSRLVGLSCVLPERLSQVTETLFFLAEAVAESAMGWVW